MPHAHAHGRKQQLARSHGVGKHARGERTADAAGQRVSATAGGSEDWLLGARLAAGTALPAGRTDEIVSKLRPTNASLCARNCRSRCAALTCTARNSPPRLRRDSRCSATPRPIADRQALAEASPSGRRTRAAPAERRPSGRTSVRCTPSGDATCTRHSRVPAESSPLLTAGIGLSGIQPKWESA